MADTVRKVVYFKMSVRDKAGEGARVLVIGHVATRWAFEHYLNGVSLDDLVEAEFNWREGWEYTL